MTSLLTRRDCLAGAALLASGCATLPARGPASTLWTFDNLGRIGGLTPEVEGAPRLTTSPWGQAVLFDGAKDAVFMPAHPIAGWPVFTIEALFRPDGGAMAQRWMHLQEIATAPGAPASETRVLFEIRTENGEWWLDSFVKGPTYNQALIDPAKRHPVGQWHHVAQTYDGRTYRAYVGGQLEAEAQITFTPQGPGRSSVGCRFNRVDYFKGAVRSLRFTPRALSPDAFTRA